MQVSLSDSLCERFEDIVDSTASLSEADVSLSNGVLTVQLPDVGTYVINKQAPNRQIWLSSPRSGPARFDFVHERYVTSILALFYFCYLSENSES